MTHFKYKDELIKESKKCSGFLSGNGINDSELKCNFKSKYTYDTNSKLISVSTKTNKKYLKKKKRKTDLTTFHYDENDNPIRIKKYIIDNLNDTLLIGKLDRKYDSQPNLYYNCRSIAYYPGLVKNNITYDKYSDLGENPKIRYEYKFIYEYDENGLVTKVIKEIIHGWPESKIGKSYTYTFDYNCE